LTVFDMFEAKLMCDQSKDTQRGLHPPYKAECSEAQHFISTMRGNTKDM
jgi:hypothetical protein